MNNSKRVLQIATITRRIAEEVSPVIVKGFGIFPPNPFPGGWCQDTSRVLGKLLADRGETGFKLVFGCQPKRNKRTHVWLERDGVIVDVTADQFEPEIITPVMVTTDRSWHDGWKHRVQDLDDVISYQADGILYRAISEHRAWLEFT